MEAKYFRFLKMVGLGMKAKAEAEGRLLYMRLGRNQEIELPVPPAVRVFCFKPNIICCAGIDRERVSQFTEAVRSCKPLEYHKGIVLMDDYIKKKMQMDGKTLPNEQILNQIRRTVLEGIS